MVNYHGKKFKVVENSDNGEVSENTIFHYFQDDDIISGTYSGGEIENGTLIGVVNPDGSLDFRYNHVSIHKRVRSGMCHSVPEFLPNGKLRMHEEWQWNGLERDSGNSIVEEI
ncbi:n-acetylglutamate synthase [Listeria booriae]|uniref:n-acetylglutamate synthase n=1 Tax=Listeria booriae TaxID=1552123 RepID=UPI001629AC32|nr:n-acetylglutamate synthase [Listeria booriae]MBC2171204.1 n-acetylglutamate synthase [Listeria booriae]